MRIHAKHVLAGLGVVFLTLPVWAHTNSADLQIDNPAVIGGTQLKPGQYELRVKDGATQVSVVQDGKVVAQVPCKWIQLPKKAENSEVTVSENRVSEIDFSGKTEAVQFP
jgi:hypothetical protein